MTSVDGQYSSGILAGGAPHLHAKVSGSIPLSGKLIVNYYHGNIMPINVFKKKL